MLTLAIETSGRAGTIALLKNDELQAEIELTASGRRHARTLVPEIGRLLREHALQPQQIQLVAVSIGPGSFTGLRVGLVCAKTFAYAVGCPITGIDTFQAVAAAQKQRDHVWVIEDALRGDVCAGEYRREQDQWINVTPPKLLSLDVWRSQLVEETFLSGPGLAQYADQLASYPQAALADRTPRAAQIARLGMVRLRAGLVDDPWRLEPFYMRRSAAEEKADASDVSATG